MNTDPSGSPRLRIEPQNGRSASEDSPSCSRESLEVIVGRLHQGESSALKELMAIYWRPLVLYGLRWGLDWMMAEDIAQEVFIRVWQRRTTLRHETLRAFLYTIARNLGRDEERRRAIRLEKQQDLSWMDEPLMDNRSQEAALREAVDAAIDELSPRRKEVFVLGYFHRLSYREIAAVLSIEKGTVKKHMSAALSDLREQLKFFWADMLSS